MYIYVCVYEYIYEVTANNYNFLHTLQEQWYNMRYMFLLLYLYNQIILDKKAIRYFQIPISQKQEIIE